MVRIGKWLSSLLMLFSSSALAQEAVQTQGAAAPEGLPWGDAAIVLVIVFVVMAGLVLFGWLKRR
jgi:hypothetical protein